MLGGVRKEAVKVTTTVFAFCNRMIWRVLHPDGEFRREQVWEEGHKFGFGRDEFETSKRTC